MKITLDPNGGVDGQVRESTPSFRCSNCDVHQHHLGLVHHVQGHGLVGEGGKSTKAWICMSSTCMHRPWAIRNSSSTHEHLGGIEGERLCGHRFEDADFAAGLAPAALNHDRTSQLRNQSFR